MSDLFRIRYPGQTPRGVLYEYIKDHPGCTRTDLLKDLPSISHESYLKMMIRRGEITKYGDHPQRYRVRD